MEKILFTRNTSCRKRNEKKAVWKGLCRNESDFSMYKKCCNAVMTPSSPPPPPSSSPFSCVSSTVNGDHDEICIMSPLMLVVFLRAVLNRIKPHSGIRSVSSKPEVLLRVSHWKRGRKLVGCGQCGIWNSLRKGEDFAFDSRHCICYHSVIYFAVCTHINVSFSTDQVHHFSMQGWWS